MALTNPKDFEILMKLIPPVVEKNIWFFPIRQDRKNPDVPGGTILKENAAYRMTKYESLKRLKWGKNIGMYALPGGLMFLDLDVRDGKLLASQRFLEILELNPTLTIKSRNGGIQKYFLNIGLYANQLLKEGGVIIGELRTNWQYVVAVGSHVDPDEHCRGEPDGTYRIQMKCPISQFHGIRNEYNTCESLKHMGEQKEETIIKKGILAHDRSENQTTNIQHIQELMKIGITRKIRRKVI